MAGVAAIIGLATALFIKEPERGRYIDEATKKKEAEKKAKKEAELAISDKNPISSFFENINLVLKMPCARNTLIAASLRNFGGMILSSYLAVYFGRCYPAYRA